MARQHDSLTVIVKWTRKDDGTWADPTYSSGNVTYSDPAATANVDKATRCGDVSTSGVTLKGDATLDELRDRLNGVAKGETKVA